MKKKLYLHIGARKTGTTSVQHFLADHRQWLREQGYLYPTSQFKEHHPLARSILNDMADYHPATWHPYKGDHETLWKHLRDEIDSSNCPVVVVSTEHFCDFATGACRPYANTMIRWLAKQLKGLDVRVVCYLRPLGDYTKSIYKHLTKEAKNSSTLAEFLENQIKHQSIHVAPTNFLDLFASQFGSENMILRSYDRDQLVRGNSIDDFLDVVGLPPHSQSGGTQGKNPSIPDELVDLKRTFNALSGSSPREAKNMGRMITKMSVAAFARPTAKENILREALQAEHQKLAENYGLDLGTVDDPFGGPESGSIEARGQSILISELYRQLRESQKAMASLQSEVAQLRAERGEKVSSD